MADLPISSNNPVESSSTTPVWSRKTTVCPECRKDMRNRKALMNHLNKVHKLTAMMMHEKYKTASFACPDCNWKSVSAISLRNHLSRRHGKTVLQSRKMSKQIQGRRCPLQDQPCSLKEDNATALPKLVRNWTELDQHLSKEHQAAIAYQHHTFSTTTNFLAWKDEMQCHNQSDFIRISGGTQPKITYQCSRAQPVDNRPRKTVTRWGKGSRKLGIDCPARLECEFKPDGSVVVCAQLQHFGHTVDIKFKKPSQFCSQFLQSIAEQIARPIGRLEQRSAIEPDIGAVRSEKVKRCQPKRNPKR